MSHSTFTPPRGRRGAVVVLAALLLVVMLGMVAFALDIGYIAVVKSELQNAADAGATAGAAGLIDSASVARRQATAYGERNKAAARDVTIYTNQDVVVGLWDASSRTFKPATGPQELTANAVQVTTRVNSNRGNEARLFFARIFGRSSVDTSATATAALWSDLRGFRAPANGDNLPLLPITLDLLTWQDAMAGLGPDNWSWDSGLGQPSTGADGVPEVNLYPDGGTGASGNRGLIEIGPDGGKTGALRDQIRKGISASDLKHHGGSLELDSGGQLTLGGEPGVTATLKSELSSIVGEARIVPVFEQVSASGDNSSYTIVKFAGVRIMEVDLNGSPKRIMAQPAYIYVHGAIANTSGGSPSSNYIYSAPHLVQ